MNSDTTSRPQWCKRLLRTILFAPLLWSACQHPPQPSPPAENHNGSQQVLIEEGESSQATYSPKGDKLLFVSGSRAAHKQPQVYEKDLYTGQERRITYQNGGNMHPRYHPKENLIVYASSTDELKENPPMLNPNATVSKLPLPYQAPTEVYLHSLGALEVTRLSNRFGFDGEPHFSNDVREIVWTRVTNQKTEIVTIHRTTQLSHTLKNLGTNPTQLVVSRDGKTMAWIDWDETFGVARLRVQKGKEKPVEIGAENIVHKTDLSFSFDSNWLLWAQKDSKLPVYDLWALDLDGLCSRRLTTSSDGERRHPTLSPDMSWLTYTWVRHERSRIARTRFEPPAGSCPTPP